MSSHHVMCSHCPTMRLQWRDTKNVKMGMALQCQSQVGCNEVFGVNSLLCLCWMSLVMSEKNDVIRVISAWPRRL